MAKKKSTRLNPPDSDQDLIEVLESRVDSDMMTQFRPRTSRYESAWKPLPEDHLVNAQKYNYRVAEPPRIQIVGHGKKRRIVVGEHEVTLQIAEKILAVWARAKKRKKQVILGDNEAHKQVGLSYPITSNSRGHLSVGCKSFTPKELDDLTKRLRSAR